MIEVLNLSDIQRSDLFGNISVWRKIESMWSTMSEIQRTQILGC